MQHTLPTGDGITDLLLELLQGEKVLVYAGDDRSEMKRFVQAFRSRLETDASESHKTRSA
jgi:hypothetical protein